MAHSTARYGGTSVIVKMWRGVVVAVLLLVAGAANTRDGNCKLRIKCQRKDSPNSTQCRPGKVDLELISPAANPLSEKCLKNNRCG